MKYSFMTFSCPELTLAEALAAAKRYGYDGIEPRAECKHGHGVEIEADASARAAIRKTAESSGVALCCIATSCCYADPAQARDMATRTAQFIDLAGDVGAPRLRVFGGTIPEGVAREQAIAGVSEALRSVADRAAKRKVIVCMETHDHWCAPEHVAEVMRRVNHPAIAVNWDIMHPVRQGGADMDGAFQTLKPWIRHVHFHDGKWDKLAKLDLAPVGQGRIDHRRAVQLLRAMRYDGYLSGEWIDWTPYAEHLPREIATMKAYEREG